MRKTIMLVVMLIAFSMVSMASTKINFTDIEKHWARENIEKLVDLGITNGYQDKTFRPNNTISVLEYIAFVERAIKEAPEAWGQPYIDKAINLGLIKNGEFKDTARNIKREEMAYIIINALERVKGSIDVDQQLKSQIKDYNTITNTYADSVLKAYKIGLITGYKDGDFRPGKTATRAETATVIIRLLSKLEKPQEPIAELDFESLKKLPLRNFNTNLSYEDEKFFYEGREVSDQYVPGMHEKIKAFLQVVPEQKRLTTAKFYAYPNDEVKEEHIVLSYAYNRMFEDRLNYYFRFMLFDNWTYDATIENKQYSDKVDMFLYLKYLAEVDQEEGRFDPEIREKFKESLKSMFPDHGEEIYQYIYGIYERRFTDKDPIVETKNIGNIRIDVTTDGGLMFYFTFN